MDKTNSKLSANLPQLVTIESLKPHPRQAELFGDISEPELAALAADIAANGQKQPIEILPDLTIIAGHQRVRAMRLLGRSHIMALVRDDVDAVAANKVFIDDNLLRRHLEPVTLARCCKALIDNDAGGDPLERPKKYRLNRDALAARLRSLGCHVSGRTIDRYLTIVKLPRPLQDAIAAKRLPMTAVPKILSLRQDALHRFAAHCRSGASRTDLLAFLRGDDDRPRPGSLRAVVEAIGRHRSSGAHDFDGRGRRWRSRG